MKKFPCLPIEDDSPFIQKSPVIIKDNNLYAIMGDGYELGPLCKADCIGDSYLVFASNQGAILSNSGNIISDIVYDHAYNENGYTVLEKDGKFGFYSHYEKVLIPCIYDDLETPEDPYEPIVVTKCGVEGLVSSDGSFHPLTNNRDRETSLIYL